MNLLFAEMMSSSKVHVILGIGKPTMITDRFTTHPLSTSIEVSLVRHSGATEVS